MKKLTLLLALSIIHCPLSIPVAFAGTNAAVTVNTNTFVVSPTNLWRTNAAAIIDALTNANFSSGGGSSLIMPWPGQPTNFASFGDSEAIINGNTGLTDTNIGWIYQFFRSFQTSNSTSLVMNLSGNTQAGNVNILFTNAAAGIASNQCTIYSLVQNDFEGGIGYVASDWQAINLAQVARMCFAAGDPGFFSGWQLYSNTGACSFSTGWTNTANTNLQGWGATVTAKGGDMTNFFGRSALFCVDLYTNGTGALLAVYVDGVSNTTLNCNITRDGSVVGSVPYSSNSIPGLFILSGFANVLHTLAFTNLGTAPHTNLGIDYIAFPDMRLSAPAVVDLSGLPNPGANAISYATNLLTFGAVSSNVWALDQVGLPVSFLNICGVFPQGTHGTSSTAHPAPYEHTNLAVFAEQMVPIIWRQSLLFGSVNSVLNLPSLNVTRTLTSGSLNTGSLTTTTVVIDNGASPINFLSDFDFSSNFAIDAPPTTTGSGFTTGNGATFLEQDSGLYDWWLMGNSGADNNGSGNGQGHISDNGCGLPTEFCAGYNTPGAGILINSTGAVSNGITVTYTNFAPTGITWGTTQPDKWFAITFAGTNYMVPGFRNH